MAAAHPSASWIFYHVLSWVPEEKRSHFKCCILFFFENITHFVVAGSKKYEVNNNAYTPLIFISAHFHLHHPVNLHSRENKNNLPEGFSSRPLSINSQHLQTSTTIQLDITMKKLLLEASFQMVVIMVLLMSPWIMTFTTAFSHYNRELQQQQQQRQVQTTTMWDISIPEISYSGMQLDLAHTVGDHVRTNYVSVEVFRDEQCSSPIDESSNNYLIVDIVNDNTPFGDGSSFRTVRTFTKYSTCFQR